MFTFITLLLDIDSLVDSLTWLALIFLSLSIAVSNWLARFMNSKPTCPAFEVKQNFQACRVSCTVTKFLCWHSDVVTSANPSRSFSSLNLDQILAQYYFDQDSEWLKAWDIAA